MKAFFHLFSKAFQKAAKIKTAVDAFKCTEIYLLDVNIFDKEFNKSQENTSPLSNNLTKSENSEVSRCARLLQKIKKIEI